jgi:hypothetical protein
MDRRTFMLTTACVAAPGCMGTQSRSATDSDTGETQTSSSDSETLPSEDDDLDSDDASRWVSAGDVEVTVGGARLVEAVRRVGGDVVRATPNNHFLLVEVEARNRSATATETPPRQAFSVRVGTEEYGALAIAGYDPVDEAYGQIWPDRIYEDTLPTEVDGTRSGYLVFEVPTGMTEFVFTWNRVGIDGPVYTWQGVVDPTQMADLTVDAVESPSTVVNGGIAPVRVTVTNHGPAAGLFAAEWELTRDIGPHARELLVNHEFNEVIEPGETRTVVRTVDATATQELTFTVDERETTHTSVVPARRPFGEPYTNSTGVDITIGPPVLSETVSIDRMTEQVTYDSTAGDQYATFVVEAANPSGEPLTTVTPRNVTVHAEGRASRLRTGRRQSASLLAPIEGEFYRVDRNFLPPGAAERGLGYATVLQAASVADLTVRVSIRDPEGGEEVCEWSHSP